MDRIADLLSLLIFVVGGFVFIIFTTISIRDIRFDNIPAFFGVTTFTKFGLGLFLAHWSWGVRKDLQLQSRYYHADPDKAKLAPRSIVAIAGFIPFFIALVWFHTEPVVFQLLLLGLIGMNFFSWATIIAQSNRMAQRSRKELRRDRDWFALEQLELVCDYMNGRWQVIRFLVLLGLAVAQVIVAMALAGWWGALDGLHRLLADMFGPDLLPHIPGLFFFLYVLISSAWMGTMRIRVLFGTKVIGNLIGTYEMELRQIRRAAAKPRPARSAPKPPARPE